MTASSPTWDFASSPVDVVVVNIGANDSWRPKNQNKSRYHTLLDDLRAAHPAAHIMLFNAYGWDSGEPANYTREVIAERADPDMSWEVFPWVFEQYHGCQTDHAGMARHLADHLTSITGWSAGEPDVVSGYGRNGDVANGSFEELAPFGGWGWRYFDDPGVSRIFDPTRAQHGDHYLRLENGASAHQTNPAGNGDVISSTMWMRGANDGDTVDVTISFRDQDGGGEINGPMQQTTETMTLSTSWQRYAMAASAPADPPNPVYSARLAFTAGFGDTVDIDLVAIGSPNEVAGVRWIDKNTMTWNPEASAVAYHLYGGLISELTCGFSGTCWDDRDALREDLLLTDVEIPLVDECRFYLVTTEDAAGNEGPLGRSACGERVSSFPCP